MAENERSRDLLVVVTGLSGAGKSTALNALEDLSFYCVDNLPTPLIHQALEVCAHGGLRRVAFGLDVRVRSFIDGASAVLSQFNADDHELVILYLDASDETLLRRYSETRRPHPLSTVEQNGDALAVVDGIRMERERLVSLRASATHVVDTTKLSVHELRRHVVNLLSERGGAHIRMSTRILSFGFKHGMPVDADLVFDVRFLDNPYFVPALKFLPGTNPDVDAYVFNNPESHGFFERALELLTFTVPKYEREGKAYLTVAFGCTGGQHRSVAMAERIGKKLGTILNLPIQIVHRDVGRVKAVPLDTQAERPSQPNSEPQGGT
jgi:RNase adapter protein RapZ